MPVLLDSRGAPLKRSFVHVSDLVGAILAALGNEAARGQLFNIGMNEPVDYAAATQYLGARRGLPAVSVATPYHSNWFDNAKARQMLGWQPLVGLEDLIDRAWDYVRAPDDPRVVWYPG